MGCACLWIHNPACKPGKIKALRRIKENASFSKSRKKAYLWHIEGGPKPD